MTSNDRKENGEAQVDRQKKFQVNDKNRKTKNWEDKIQLGNPFEEYREDFFRFLSEFESMWDGHLGWIRIAKHWIGLTADDTHPIQCAPYIYGLYPQELEWMGIAKMLAMDNIEPTQTEWAAPVVFALKSMVCYSSVSNIWSWTRWTYGTLIQYRSWLSA